MTRVAILLLVVFGAAPGFAADSCPEYPDDDRAGNAGCFLVLEDRLLMVRGRFAGTLSLPGGTTEPGELARDTARRETLEETGLKVCVRGLLSDLDRRFLVYRCTALAPVRAGELVTPEAWRHEVSQPVAVDPCTLDDAQMRFPAQRVELCELLRRRSGKEHQAQRVKPHVGQGQVLK